MYSLRSVVLTAFSGLTLASLLGGCVFLPTETVSLPAEIELVAANPSTYAPDSDHPLANVTTGTVLDDLSGLTGCWGVYGDGLGETTFGSTGIFYEVYSFDTAAGQVQRWVLTPSWLFIPAMLVVDVGTYEVAEAGRIEIMLDNYTLTNLVTGTSQQFDNLPNSVASLEKLVTLSGSKLLLASPDYVDETTGEPIGRMYTRFDCP